MNRNPNYRGPEIMIRLYRGTDYPWECRAIRAGRLKSKAMRNELDRERIGLGTTYEDPTRELEGHGIPTYLLLSRYQGRFSGITEREARNLHSCSSGRCSIPGEETPNSRYVSLTINGTEAARWANAHLFRFDIWRSDVWKGNYQTPGQITIDPVLAILMGLSYVERTPPDWDRGSEYEWLAEGGTRIYNVEESANRGQTWNAVPQEDD